MKTPCPCGAPSTYADCCGRLIESGEPAPTAEALMRSRYTAFTLADEAYLLRTWHPATRPSSLDLHTDVQPKWLGLKVIRHAPQDATHATVEFVARYKIAGRGHRLHETSRFERLDGQWYYRDGDLKEE